MISTWLDFVAIKQLLLTLVPGLFASAAVFTHTTDYCPSGDTSYIVTQPHRGCKRTHSMLQSFVVKKSDGSTDVTYSIAQTTGREAQYMDASSSLSAPRIIKVGHTLKPTGSKGSDRHHVLAQCVVMDANNVPYTISATITWTIPRASVVTDTLAKDVLSAAVNYQALSGVRDALIDGIIP